MNEVDYSYLDTPSVLSILFHPRPDSGRSGPPGSIDLDIPTGDGDMIGARFHAANAGGPTILFFHGNGEIASDYDDLAPFFTKLGVNFLIADYRGYGRSTGRPTVNAIMRDSHTIFRFVREWLKQHGHEGKLIVMGRSLGSASACELAGRYPEAIACLIVESGFADAAPLLTRLGLRPDALTPARNLLSNLIAIHQFTGPTLIIHAEQDHLIPFSDGVALHEASGSNDKQLLKIPGADHNDIFYVGLRPYLSAVKTMVDKIR